MKLSDIIKNDSDRLFIVDTECFIIFTGGSINDNRPFIRIGTWSDLPVEIIPLVENIIVSDRILGNPAIEQFNIDVRNLSSNRYIGGESILKRFLDYQRNFGLDLTNVSVVNIEKDIPELPDKKSISDRDQFIGVFYSDGNVKIVHDDNNIFDLNSIYTTNLNITEILGRLSQKNKSSSRYNGTGFVICDKNPIFYSDGYFTSYQFPKNYFRDFSLLEVDPGRIRELLLPSHNMIHISDIMKLKHSREGKIRIFSDNRDQLELIKKLFKNATVHDEIFSHMNYNTGNGMIIAAHHNTPNIKITFNPESKKGKEFTILFIKSPSDLKAALKESADAIVITYTAYEQSVLLFKSSQTPLIILNDGNPNIRKLSEIDNLILKNGVQYDLKLYDTQDELKQSITAENGLPDALTRGDISFIENFFKDNSNPEYDYFTLFNSITLLKIHMNATKDRKLFSALRQLLQEYSTVITALEPAATGETSFIEIAICGGACFQILKTLTRKSNEFYTSDYNPDSVNDSRIDSDQARLGRRIIEDRERLARILALFYKDKESHPAFSLMKSELNLLKEEIESRKDIYNSDFYNVSSLNRKSGRGDSILKRITGIITGSDSGDINNGVTGTGTSGQNSSDENSPVNRLEKNRIKIITAAVIILLLIAAGFLILKKQDTTPPVITVKDINPVTQNKNIVITVKRVDSEEKKLLEKHNVRITDLDIFKYANDVAIKNGYSGLSPMGLKEKNPHWIFPSNVFIMLDGEKVVVQKGDTLWDLAHAKLEKMNADFYKIMDQLEKTGPSDKDKIQAIITDAEKFLFTGQQKKFIEDYKNQYLKNE